MKTKFLFFFLIYMNFCFAQDGILLNSPNATKGYSLFTAQGETYLVDNCGKIVNSWSIPFVVRHCKLLPDGNILFMSNGKIEERNWDDQFIKSIQLNGVSLILEYEVIKLKNGNYLCVAREQVSLQRFEEYGYDIPFTNPTLSDVVIEVDGNTGKVVWRWNLLDHVIQDKFPNKRGYGVLKDNPGKIDINAISTVDWNYTESFMINGMDYNEELDQIVLSVRKIGEIVIIDHSTTTEEAKGSTGGRYNKGGDLLYRYGNPSNYDRAPESSRQLYFQHNPNWIKYGEHKNKIIVFNNLLSKENFSTVQIINPPIKTDGSYTLENNQPYMPLTPTVEYGRTQGKVQISSDYTSGAQVLPNGNIIITEGRTSTLIEIDPLGNEVWRYGVPHQGYLFRSERYSHDYPAFIGKALDPFGTVESPSSSYNCNLFSNTDQFLDKDKIFISQYAELVNVKSDVDFKMNAYNVQGQLLATFQSQNQTVEWHHTLPSQIVILQLFIEDRAISKKILINN